MVQTIFQCPYSGGKSVYIARNFLEKYYQEGIEYDDATNCLAQGFYRSSAQNEIPVSLENEIIISPNPTSNSFELKILNELNGVCQLKIFDGIGKLLLTKDVDCKSRDYTVDVSLLNEGIYHIEFMINNKFKWNKKLVIIK